MKLTKGLLEKIIRLYDGESIPSSQLKGDWVDHLAVEGILLQLINGSRRSYRLSNREAFLHALSRWNEALSDPWTALRQLEGETSRGEQAADTGNSKLLHTRSCPGFPVNSYEPIPCLLGGNEIEVYPTPGTFLYVCEWKQFRIPSDVIVVGVENMENFRLVERQHLFFEGCLPETRLLFVSRYPQSTDLREWLKIIPNRYVHFGDFDLAGINIYQTEFACHLPGRCCFLIPSDIEDRLRNGSRERYDVQYDRFCNLTSEDTRLQELIDMIHRYRRAYDQEGYIDR